MEELRQLVEILKEVPTMGMVVLGGYLLYKLVIVGSVFGVVRLLITKSTGIFTARTNTKLEANRQKADQQKREHDLQSSEYAYSLLKNITIDDRLPELMLQLRRLRGIGSGGSAYIHSRDIKWLREAIDAKKIEDKK